ncbi:MAG: MarR family transcriptional regulator [Bacteroidota bacterium]
MKAEELIQVLVEAVISLKKEVQSEELSIELLLKHLDKKNDYVPNKRILKLNDTNISQEIIVHLGRLNRYAHAYLKYNLADSAFATDMDFAFTAILQQYGEMSKMDLIRNMIYEKSSGMEIIKRLVKNGIFEQFENPEDKRSKLIKLTEYGQQEIFKAYKKAGAAAKLVSFPLDDAEKKSLFTLLSKLDTFHLEYYLEGNSDSETIIQNLGSEDSN